MESKSLFALLILLPASLVISEEACNRTVLLNDTKHFSPVEIGGTYKIGDNCQTKLEMSHYQFASLSVSINTTQDANYSISILNAVDDSYQIVDTYKYFFLPPSAAYFFVKVFSGVVTIRAQVLAYSTDNYPNVTMYSTIPGQQAYMLTVQAQNAYSFHSSTAYRGQEITVFSDLRQFKHYLTFHVSLNVLPSRGDDYNLLNAFVYNGIYPDGNIIATFYTLRNAAALFSSGKYLSIFAPGSLMYGTYAVLNDKTNLKGVASAYVASSYMFTGGLNTTMFADKGPTTLTLIFPPTVSQTETYDYVLRTASFSSNNSQLQIYAGTPIQNFETTRQYLSTYRNQNSATLLPQYISLPIVTYQLDSGTCDLQFLKGQVSWWYVEKNRQGFISTNNYPFNHERQQLTTSLSTNNENTKFTFSLRNAPSDKNISISLTTQSSVNITKSYTLNSRMDNCTLFVNAKSVFISISPKNESNSGILLDYEVEFPSSRSSTNFGVFTILLTVLVGLSRGSS